MEIGIYGDMGIVRVEGGGHACVRLSENQG